MTENEPNESPKRPIKKAWFVGDDMYITYADGSQETVYFKGAYVQNITHQYDSDAITETPLAIIVTDHTIEMEIK